MPEKTVIIDINTPQENININNLIFTEENICLSNEDKEVLDLLRNW